MERRYRGVNVSLVERHGLTEKSQVIGKRPRDICPGDFGTLPSVQDAERQIVGLIGMSRDVRAPIEAKDIPPGFADA